MSNATTKSTNHQPEGTAMTATLITTQRRYLLDEPLTVYSAALPAEFRYVGSTIRVTWKADQPLDVELCGPGHQVFRDGEWRSVGGIGGYYPVPTDQQPEWLDGRDA